MALDGPSGAGKSTLAKAVAKELGILYVDTGAIYRALGVAARRRGVDPHDEAAVTALLPEVEIALRHGEDGLQRMYLNGEDVTEAIRLPEISMYASAVSAQPAVRAFLLEMQRALARQQSVIMDGRDIGTVVLPDAQVKIFLTASAEKRAERRFLELEQKQPGVQTYEEVLADVIRRDKQDTEREIAPLRKAEDAVLVDTTNADLDQSEEMMLAVCREKLGI